MRLGLNLIHDGAVPLAQAAEALGYDVVLAPEGNRSDAPSVLGAVAAGTHRIGLLSGVMQIPARTPAMTALTAATLDELSGGRFRLGLGVSNPDIALGWYGQPFDHPLARTREYVEIVRAALRREPVRYFGAHYRLPPLEHQRAAPLLLPTSPVRPDLPIYLAAGGPQNLALTGEIADGWIGVFTTPERAGEAAETIAKARGSLTGFDVLTCVGAAIDDDPRTAADALREHVAHLLSLGEPEHNFYCRVAAGMGFGEQIARLHERRAAGDPAGAAAAVPFDFIDQTALLGPVERVAGRLVKYAQAGVTTLSVMVSAARTGLPGRLRIVHDVARAHSLAEKSFHQ
jgi:F420-dependent oxidoreductase-like protein